MVRALARAFAALTAIIVIIAGAAFWFVGALSAPGPLAADKAVIIPRGVSLSAIAQVLGFAGLLLVPLHAAWLIHEVRRCRVRERVAAVRDRGHAFALASLCAWILVAAFVALGARLAFSER